MRQGAVMPCGWEGNRRSGVALAMRHILQQFVHLRADGLRKEDEHPAYTPHGLWHSFTFLLHHKGCPTLPFPLADLSPPNTWFFEPSQVHTPNSISTGSAVKAQLKAMSSRQTQATNISNNTLHLCTLCKRCGLKIHKCGG